MRDLLKALAHVGDDPIESLFILGFVVIGCAAIVRAAIVIVMGAA
jgi:hypothetical protein